MTNFPQEYSNSLSPFPGAQNISDPINNMFAKLLKQHGNMDKGLAEWTKTFTEEDIWTIRRICHQHQIPEIWLVPTLIKSSIRRASVKKALLTNNESHIVEALKDACAKEIEIPTSLEQWEEVLHAADTVELRTTVYTLLYSEKAITQLRSAIDPVDFTEPYKNKELETYVNTVRSMLHSALAQLVKRTDLALEEKFKCTLTPLNTSEQKELSQYPINITPLAKDILDALPIEKIHFWELNDRRYRDGLLIEEYMKERGVDPYNINNVGWDKKDFNFLVQLKKRLDHLPSDTPLTPELIQVEKISVPENISLSYLIESLAYDFSPCTVGILQQINPHLNQPVLCEDLENLGKIQVKKTKRLTLQEESLFMPTEALKKLGITYIGTYIPTNKLHLQPIDFYESISIEEEFVEPFKIRLTTMEKISSSYENGTIFLFEGKEEK